MVKEDHSAAGRKGSERDEHGSVQMKTKTHKRARRLHKVEFPVCCFRSGVRATVENAKEAFESILELLSIPEAKYRTGKHTRRFFVLADIQGDEAASEELFRRSVTALAALRLDDQGGGDAIAGRRWPAFQAAKSDEVACFGCVTTPCLYPVTGTQNHGRR